MTLTLYAERCTACSTVFEYKKDSVTERYPDGTERTFHYLSGGPRHDGPDDSDNVNSLLGTLKL